MEAAGLRGLEQARWSKKYIGTTVTKLASMMGIDAPKVRYVSMAYAGIYDPTGHAIELSTSKKSRGRSPLVVLHEMAHAVLGRWDPLDILDDHGPEFVGIYADLLAVTGLVPYHGFRVMCEHYGVEYLDTSRMHKPSTLHKAVVKRIRARMKESGKC
jgi:hypothetical protein